jgi:hypothetical protein
MAFELRAPTFDVSTTGCLAAMPIGQAYKISARLTDSTDRHFNGNTLG